MTKLERLRMERKALDRLALLPAQMRRILVIYYDTEIAAIEKYGAENPAFRKPPRK